jgi:hypothetical protein
MAEASALAQRDFPTIGLDCAGENLQQRRFARAVRPDQSDAVALGNGEGDIPEKWRGPVALRDTLSIENRWQVVKLPLSGYFENSRRRAGVSAIIAGLVTIETSSIPVCGAERSM